MDVNELAGRVAMYNRVEARQKKFQALLSEMEAIVGKIKTEQIDPEVAAKRMIRIESEVAGLRVQQMSDAKQLEAWEKEKQNG